MTSPTRRILYLQYTNPGGYPPLEHSTRILADEGWNVCLLGLALQPELRFPAHPRILVALLPVVAAGWRQKVHYFYYWIWVLWWVLRWRPQWIYASDPLSAPIGLSLSYLPRIKVIYHEHDSPTSNTPPSAFMRGVMWARRRLARRVEVNILPNESRTEKFRADTNTKRRVLTVWNCPSLREVSPPRRAQSHGLKLLYHGAIVEGRPSLLLLQTLKLLPNDVELFIIGYETSPHPNVIETWRRLAEQNGVADRLFIKPPLPRHELLAEVSRYDVGIGFMPPAVEDINYRGMVGASNKAFDYMAGGLVVLVNNETEWQVTYEKPGFGLSCNPEEPQDIANIMQWLLVHPIERLKIGETGRQKILGDWNYEYQFQPILEQIRTH